MMRLAGHPTMSKLVEGILEIANEGKTKGSALQTRFGTKVASFRRHPRASGGDNDAGGTTTGSGAVWELFDEKQGSLGLFDWVICAAGAPDRAEEGSGGANLPVGGALG